MSTDPQLPGVPRLQDFASVMLIRAPPGNQLLHDKTKHNKTKRWLEALSFCQLQSCPQPTAYVSVLNFTTPSHDNETWKTCCLNFKLRKVRSQPAFERATLSPSTSIRDPSSPNCRSHQSLNHNIELLDFFRDKLGWRTGVYRVMFSCRPDSARRSLLTLWVYQMTYPLA